jgi:two-component system, OmpR family, response regulator VicR
MRSILLVDDDAAIRLLLRDFLTDQGFVVHTARDGQHGVHMLEKLDAPDLILLDYKMPVMDGKQFLTIVRRMPQLQDVPVVILSAATREWSGAHLEVAEVLSKPIDLALLLGTVNRLFALKEQAATAPLRIGAQPPPNSRRSTTLSRNRHGGFGT